MLFEEMNFISLLRQQRRGEASRRAPSHDNNVDH
jgi:hypothetical protein